MQHFEKRNWYGAKRCVLNATAFLAVLVSTVIAQETPWEFHVLVDTSNSMKSTMTGVAASGRPYQGNTRIQEVQSQLGQFCSELPGETTVLVYAFDTSLRSIGPAGGITIYEDKHRDAVRALFSELQVRNQNTHLWSALETVIERASRSVYESPGKKVVRILAYTDGDDNEPNGPAPEEVFDKYRDLIQGTNGFRVNLVTLGFDLKAKRELQSRGVEVVRAGESLAPLMANYRVIPSDPIEGQVVQFVDRSTGIIRDFLWDFGDGSPKSHGRAPTHIYRKPGQYRIELKINGIANVSTSMPLALTVRPRPAVEPRFELPGKNFASGQKVVFMNKSTGLIKSFQWDFGDGETLTEGGTPVHVYRKPGKYTPRLTVIGDNGETGIYEFAESESITVYEPRPEFSVPSLVRPGEPVSFFGRFPGVCDEIHWDFGDDGSETGKLDVTHTYQKPGRFTVALSVHGCGAQYRTETDVEVVDFDMPKVEFTFFPEKITVGQSVKFFSRIDGNVDEVHWLLSDGTEVGTSPDLVHVFDTPGDVEVILTATGRGGVGETSRRITVLPASRPDIDIVCLEQVAVDEPVKFSGNFQGAVESVQWNFGDGSPTSGERQPRHTYSRAGTFTVTLAATGRFGVDEAAKQIVVQGPVPPTVRIVCDDQVMAGNSLQLVAVTGGQVDELKWSFGDQPPAIGEDVVKHEFPAPGRIPVTVTARGPGGETGNKKEITVVPVPAPASVFSVGLDHPTSGDVIAFTDLSTGRPESARWDFGDGSDPVVVDYVGEDAGTSRIVRHAYTAPGDYHVCLVATGPGGEAETHELVHVSAPDEPIKASFEVESVEENSRMFRYRNHSVGRISECEWDFGDGSPPVRQSGISDASHTYADPGEYTAALTVISDSGGKSRFTQSISISPPFPWWTVWTGVGVCGFGLILWLAGTAYQRRHEERLMACPTGVVSYKPASDPDAPWKEVPVQTVDRSFEFLLDGPNGSADPDSDSHSRSVGSLVRSAEGAYLISVRDRDSVDECPIEPSEEISLLNYRFRYTT